MVICASMFLTPVAPLIPGKCLPFLPLQLLQAFLLSHIVHYATHTVPRRGKGQALQLPLSGTPQHQRIPLMHSLDAGVQCAIVHAREYPSRASGKRNSSSSQLDCP